MSVAGVVTVATTAFCWRQYQPNRRRPSLWVCPCRRKLFDLCSVAFTFENCNAFHTFKVLRFPVPRFPPRATWCRVFQSCLFHPSNLVLGFPVPSFPVPRFQRPLLVRDVVGGWSRKANPRFQYSVIVIAYLLNLHFVRKLSFVLVKRRNLFRFDSLVTA